MTRQERELPVGTRSGDTSRRSRAGMAFGVMVPLALSTLAFALWCISDRAGQIGPLDRAAFGWVVVIPLWVAAPVAAGLAWRRLDRRAMLLAALAVGAAVGIAAAVLFWQSVAYPACEVGPARTAAEWVLPALVFGTVIGAGVSVSGLATAWAARVMAVWRSALVGAALEVALVFAAVLVAGLMLMGPGCQRPPLLP